MQSNVVVVVFGVVARPSICFESVFTVDLRSGYAGAVASRRGDKSCKLLLMEGTLIISGT